MRKGKGAQRNGWLSGALIFFVLIAAIIQIAMLIFDYIAERTQNKGVIALLMLAVILILATFCTVIDIVRRKRTVQKPVERILQATEAIAAGDFCTKKTPR